MKPAFLLLCASAAALLSACSAGAPIAVSKESIMAKAGTYSKGYSWRYIGATGNSVYLEYNKLALFGNSREIWAAPQKEFTEAEMKTLEQRRHRRIRGSWPNR